LSGVRQSSVSHCGRRIKIENNSRKKCNLRNADKLLNGEDYITRLFMLYILYLLLLWKLNYDACIFRGIL
jgi:hypothetical protein